MQAHEHTVVSSVSQLSDVPLLQLIEERESHVQCQFVQVHCRRPSKRRGGNLFVFVSLCLPPPVSLCMCVCVCVCVCVLVFVYPPLLTHR